jgi:nitroimidazol reductase NimA-like FMN-containing flavoprotein (pyridoxamine 5'-phosphate oxidase superfamily)
MSADLAARARRTLAHNRYLALATVDPSGRPRVSPVWFSFVDHRDVYWLSSPESHHSRNIEDHPEVSTVVFDSRADPHTGHAVYLDATAGRVPESELGDACTAAFRGIEDALSWTPQTLQGAPFVLYRARVTAAEVHVRGDDREHGTGVDRRVPVAL